MEDNGLEQYRIELQAVINKKQLIAAYNEAKRFAEKQNKKYKLKYLIRIW